MTKKKPPPKACVCQKDSSSPKPGNLPEEDKSDFQVMKEMLNRLTLPYIRPLVVPPSVPKDGDTAVCLLVGDYWNRQGSLCLCFDKDGAYTGFMAGKKFVQAGGTCPRVKYLH